MNDNSISQDFKSGFVAIVGAPNVGKSTLLNNVLGQKISIISSKSQTTRNRILGIYHQPQYQIVFIDTPGVHITEKKLNVRMVDAAFSALKEVDIILLMIDASRPDSESEKLLLEKLKKRKKPVVLALNKVDLIKKTAMLPVIEKWSLSYDFNEIIPISALQNFQMDILLKALEDNLPPGPPYYPDDSITDLTEKFIAAEMIREKIFQFTSHEIPYSTVVTIESFKENKSKNNPITSINASIHVERDSQKGIIIGKNGTTLKRIGIKAREDIEKMTGVKVFLKLFVRLQKNWTKDTRALRRFGY